jgi:hypothetical protein
MVLRVRNVRGILSNNSSIMIGPTGPAGVGPAGVGSGLGGIGSTGYTGSTGYRKFSFHIWEKSKRF